MGGPDGGGALDTSQLLIARYRIGIRIVVSGWLAASTLTGGRKLVRRHWVMSELGRCPYLLLPDVALVRMGQANPGRYGRISGCRWLIRCVWVGVDCFYSSCPEVLATARGPPMPGSGQVHVKSTGEFPPRRPIVDGHRMLAGIYSILIMDRRCELEFPGRTLSRSGTLTCHFFGPTVISPLILNLPNSILTATSPSSPLITQSHRLAGISSI